MQDIFQLYLILILLIIIIINIEIVIYFQTWAWGWVGLKLYLSLSDIGKVSGETEWLCRQHDELGLYKCQMVC